MRIRAESDCGFVRSFCVDSVNKPENHRFLVAADYSNGYFHRIPRFEPELHKQITTVLTAFKKGIEHQNDLFIAKD